MSDQIEQPVRGQIAGTIIKAVLAFAGLILLFLLVSKSFREFTWNLTTSDAEKASYEIFGNTDHADAMRGVSADDLADLKANEQERLKAAVPGTTMAGECQKPAPNNMPFFVTDAECVKRKNAESARLQEATQ